jgi:hypothetical protein
MMILSNGARTAPIGKKIRATLINLFLFSISLSSKNPFACIQITPRP